MKILKQIIYTFLLIILFCAKSFADEADNLNILIPPYITSIGYESNLNNDSVININGAGLDTCNLLKVNNNSIKFLNVSAELISYKFLDAKNYNGNIVLQCSGKTLNTNFSFPYIKAVSGIKSSKFDGNITISGEGFGENPTVQVDGGTFSIVSYADNVIYGKISEEINSNQISVINSSGIKSNLFNLNIFLPKITHITSDLLFKKGSNINIYGDNLNYYLDSKVKIGDEFYTNFNYDKVKKSISIKIPDIIGDNTIQVYSNGFYSNTLTFFSDYSRPEISKVSQENIDGVNNLIISGKNFWTDQTKVSVLLNYENISIKDFNSSVIYIDNYNLIPGNNIIEVIVNGKKSKIFNFITSSNKLPELNSFLVSRVENENRIFEIGVSNFNNLTDEIQFNGSKLEIISCSLLKCLVGVDKNVLTGEFSLVRGKYTSSKKLYFDIIYENNPYITSITFDATPARGVGYTINGGNFSNAEVGGSNMIQLDESGATLIRILGNTIRGNLPIDYDVNSPSSLSISINGLTAGLEFIGKDLGVKKILKGPALINKLVSDSQDGLFKNGVKVFVLGKSINDQDIINIGGIQTKIIYSNTADPYFYFPKIDTYGEKEVFITNSDGIKSNVKTIINSSQSDTDKIYFKYNSTKENKFYINNSESLNSELYNISVLNKSKDIFVKNIGFQIKNYKDTMNIGTFYLKVGDTIYGQNTLPDSKGNLLFTDNMLIKKSMDLNNILLYKKTDFIDEANLQISFKYDNIIFSTQDNFIFKNYDISNFLENNIDIINLESSSCIDSLESKINCNNLVEKTTSNNNTNLQENNTNTNLDQTIIKPTLLLKDYKYKNKGLLSLYTKFENIYDKLLKTKQDNELLEAQKYMNNVLTDLYLYEKSSNNKQAKIIAIKKLKADITELVKIIKN